MKRYIIVVLLLVLALQVTGCTRYGKSGMTDSQIYFKKMTEAETKVDAQWNNMAVYFWNTPATLNNLQPNEIRDKKASLDKYCREVEKYGTYCNDYMTYAELYYSTTSITSTEAPENMDRIQTSYQNSVRDYNAVASRFNELYGSQYGRVKIIAA